MSSTGPAATQGTPAPGILKVPRSIVLDVSLAASALLFPQPCQIPSDASFEWDWISAFRSDSRVKLLIMETGVGNRALIYSGAPNNPNAFFGILIDNWAGLVANNGAFPLPTPYIMPANRQYLFQFSDASAGAAGTNTIQIALHGYALLAN
jgi:hypothetical protein